MKKHFQQYYQHAASRQPVNRQLEERIAQQLFDSQEEGAREKRSLFERLFERRLSWMAMPLSAAAIVVLIVVSVTVPSHILQANNLYEQSQQLSLPEIGTNELVYVRVKTQHVVDGVVDGFMVQHLWTNGRDYRVDTQVSDGSRYSRLRVANSDDMSFTEYGYAYTAGQTNVQRPIEYVTRVYDRELVQQKYGGQIPQYILDAVSAQDAVLEGTARSVRKQMIGNAFDLHLFKEELLHAVESRISTTATIDGVDVYGFEQGQTTLWLTPEARVRRTDYTWADNSQTSVTVDAPQVVAVEDPQNLFAVSTWKANNGLSQENMRIHHGAIVNPAFIHGFIDR